MVRVEARRRYRRHPVSPIKSSNSAAGRQLEAHVTIVADSYVVHC